MGTWYLIYCKRGQQQRARVNLEYQQVVCFTPVRQVEKITNGKRVLTQQTLFPNYLFIQFDPEQIHTTTISATRGVSHFVRFGLLPATIPQAVINALMQQPIATHVEQISPRPGDSVQITDGIFTGLKAIYAEPDGEARSILLLNLVSQQVSCSLRNDEFEKQG